MRGPSSHAEIKCFSMADTLGGSTTRSCTDGEVFIKFLRSDMPEKCRHYLNPPLQCHSQICATSFVGVGTMGLLQRADLRQLHQEGHH